MNRFSFFYFNCYDWLQFCSQIQEIVNVCFKGKIAYFCLKFMLKLLNLGESKNAILKIEKWVRPSPIISYYLRHQSLKLNAAVCRRAQPPLLQKKINALRTAALKTVSYSNLLDSRRVASLDHARFPSQEKSVGENLNEMGKGGPQNSFTNRSQSPSKLETRFPFLQLRLPLRRSTKSSDYFNLFCVMIAFCVPIFLFEPDCFYFPIN
jgi:hypothetical protein